MALKIGTFYQRNDHFEGTLETRKLHDLGTIIIAPHEKTQETSPDYLIKANRFEIGRAWKHTSKDGSSEYLNVILDDPHMESEIRARLVRHEDKHILLWERMAE